MKQQRILLIIGGGIAAYKCLDLIRRLREAGASVRAVMTRAATQFVTPLSVGALSNERVFTDLFDLNDEQEIGHIRLARDADLFLAEATYVEQVPADLRPYLSSARLAGRQAADAGAGRLLLTHLWPGTDPAAARAAAADRFDGVVGVAAAGLVLGLR